jgi:hypothetical protein
MRKDTHRPANLDTPPLSATSMLIRLPTSRDESPEPWRLSDLDSATAAARPTPRRGRDEDEDEDEDDEEEERPRARKKRPRDDDDEDERPRKKVRAKKEEVEDDEEDEKPRKKSRAKKVEEEEEEEEEVHERRVPKKGTRRYQLYVVGNGLATLYGCLIALVLVAFLSSLDMAFFHVMELDMGARKAPGDLMNISGIVMFVLQAIMPLAFLVAEVMFYYTPSKADARSSLIAATIFHVLPLLLLIFWLLIPDIVTDARLAERLRYFTLIAAHACFWLGFMMVITYLKQFLYYLSDQPAGNTISTLGLFYVIVIVFGYGLYFAKIHIDFAVMYYILTPAWFLWDGGIARVHLLLVRNVQKLRKRVERLTYPDEEFEEDDKKQKKS